MKLPLNVCCIALQHNSKQVRHTAGIALVPILTMSVFLVTSTSYWPICNGMVLSYKPQMEVDFAILFQDTFVRAKSWVKELQRQASPNIVIALAGNKADLAAKRMVDFEVGNGIIFSLLDQGFMATQVCIV